MFYAGIGSRETPQDILEEMANIAKYLESKGYTLRSGGAGGADIAFSSVVSKAQIWVPWKGFYEDKRHDIRIISNDDIEAFDSIRDYHPNPNKLTVGGTKLMARNYRQIVGINEPNSEFVVCWTKDGKASGGTGQAIRIANSIGVKVTNLKTQKFPYEQI